MRKLALLACATLLLAGLATGDTYALWSQEYAISARSVGHGQVGFAVSGSHQETEIDAARDAADLVFISADEELHHEAGSTDAETCFGFTVSARADGNAGLNYEISLTETFLDTDDPVFAGASIRVARDLDGDGVGDNPWFNLTSGSPSTGAQTAVAARKAEQSAQHDWVACVTAHPEEEEYQNTATVTVHTDSGQVLSASDSWNAKFRSVTGPRLDLLQLSHEVFHS
ncbi:MAG: hypothetical protein LBQ92_01990 [Propionibacteriaceae bacterium]|jgi:hypothetical protein|nr:hypothetical protein [Propionibacteriaceae bacterium]